MTYFIRVLGGLAVEHDDAPVDLPAATQRRALIYLTVHATETVSVDRLADAVWGDDAPTAVEHAVHSLIYRLRQRLACRSPRRVDPELIESVDPGYRLTIDPLHIDGNLFTAKARAARRVLATDPASARELLTEGLGLWRGDALIDVAYDVWAAAEIRRLSETRLCACETLAEANIVLGEPELAIAELESLTERFPLRETLWALLWRAMATTGRHLDITASHRRMEELLDHQYQMSPSPHLSESAKMYALAD